MNKQNLYSAAVFITMATIWAVSAHADMAPEAATSESDTDIPALSQGSTRSSPDVQQNFGRFVKKSKHEFDADPALNTAFRNYGQYVESLHDKVGDTDDKNGRGGNSCNGQGGGPGSSMGHQPGGFPGNGAGGPSHGGGSSGGSSHGGGNNGHGSGSGTSGSGSGATSTGGTSTTGA